MKKLILLSLIGLITLSSLQSQIKTKWYTYAQAMELQKKQPRKIMIDIYTDWCGWCKRMDAETFSHPVISEYINANFYAVKFDAEGHDTILFNNYKFVNPSAGARSTHQFAQALFQAQKLQGGYPSVAYFDENMQLIKVESGYKTAPQMELWLNYLVSGKYKPTPIEEYQQTFVSKIK